jgi:hypothetical protein
MKVNVCHRLRLAAKRFKAAANMTLFFFEELKSRDYATAQKIYTSAVAK